MRWYLDTEFHEDGRIIDLIRIGLVCEDGRRYYAVSSEFDPELCNDWVKANVLPGLALDPVDHASMFVRQGTRVEIAQDIRDRLLRGDERPEIWGYFADYDWVVFCQLFGRMIDLPERMPMFCRDLKQEMARIGARRDDIPFRPSHEHNAFHDALWVARAHEWLLASDAKVCGSHGGVSGKT